MFRTREFRKTVVFIVVVLYIVLYMYQYKLSGR